ncbi:hypothetical protein L596_027995 [Steinernema carpocapsae]|uniref:Uncharacterized protein n=1 Tax=Steinernema carpocapsae TaxID=34508 RepID=A0A4U5LX72_STECR|nr:hypothetical protein L596_027995 [Steinernema carpocapsae]
MSANVYRKAKLSKGKLQARMIYDKMESAEIYACREAVNTVTDILEQRIDRSTFVEFSPTRPVSEDLCSRSKT